MSSLSHEHHAHGHHHHHHHHHHASHHPGQYSMAFAFGILLNAIYVIVEVGYGIKSNSIALIADAGHNFSDVLGLVLAWIAIKLSERKPSLKYTYGLRRSSILASLANAVMLLISVGVILVESINKLFKPEEVQSNTIILVAGIGIIINTITALMFLKNKSQDLNIESAYVHMAADALISLGVVVAGIAIHFTGLNWLDPLMGIIISIVIVWGTWRILIESIDLAVDAVPENIKYDDIKMYLQSLPGVFEVHDLHIWGMSTTEVALTAHLVLKAHPNVNELLSEVNEKLSHDFGINHATIQCEIHEGQSEKNEGKFVCELKSDEVV